MTKQQKADMYAAIETHGNRLNAIFNTGLDPVVLCKKLFQLENAAYKLTLEACNTGKDNGQKLDAIVGKVRRILAHPQHSIAIDWNGDARGHALKIFNRPDLDLPKDSGGMDCIIAPDFSPM